MRIAHLITAHANPAQLERLVMSLQHPDADFYLFIDLKTDIAPFLEIGNLPNVKFIEKRVSIFWGEYSIVQSTIIGMNEILSAKKEYDYINLLSGSDYPIKSTEFIHQYLSDNSNCAFFEYYDIYTEWTEAIFRLTKYDLGMYRTPGKYFLQNVINTILPNRKMPNKLVPVGRSGWFTVSCQCAKYILDYLKNNPNVVQFFKLTWASDEIIFQTILFNSPFRENMVNNNLRHIDWSKGGVNPKVLTMEDAPKLSASDRLFARKFDARVDSQILDYLDEHR
jgi:hypothetical protein